MFGHFLLVYEAAVGIGWYSVVMVQKYSTDPLHKISALQADLELAGNFRNEIECLLGLFFSEKNLLGICRISTVAGK